MVDPFRLQTKVPYEQHTLPLKKPYPYEQFKQLVEFEQISQLFSQAEQKVPFP